MFTLQPAVGKDFINREGIIREMLSSILNRKTRIGFALIGPRRIGKSSILKELTLLLKEKQKKIVPVYFSIWELIETTVEGFCKSFSLSILNAYRPHLSIKYKIKQLLKVPLSGLIEFLKSIDIHIRIIDEMEILLSKRDKEERLEDLVQKVFLLPEKLAEETSTRCLIMLDEFPSITELTKKNGTYIGEGILRKVRTISEDYKYTIIFVSGSIKKTIGLTLLDATSPFYRQFIVRNIGPFSKKDVGTLLRKNLYRPVKENVIETIHQLTGGNPFYVQFIGRALLRLNKKPINQLDIKQIFYELLREEGTILFSQEFNSLTPTEKVILYTMAKKVIYRISEIAREMNENMNLISRYLDYLSRKGILEKEQRGKYRFTDTIFEIWLRERI